MVCARDTEDHERLSIFHPAPGTPIPPLPAVCDLVLSSHNHGAVQVWASMMLWVLMPSTSFTQYD